MLSLMICKNSTGFFFFSSVGNIHDNSLNLPLYCLLTLCICLIVCTLLHSCVSAPPPALSLISQLVQMSATCHSLILPCPPSQPVKKKTCCCLLFKFKFYSLPLTLKNFHPNTNDLFLQLCNCLLIKYHLPYRYRSNTAAKYVSLFNWFLQYLHSHVLSFSCYLHNSLKCTFPLFLHL